VPRPEPKENEILIRVIAGSVNPVDAAIRQGYLAQLIGDKLPLIPGMDAAGVVEKPERRSESSRRAIPFTRFSD
jgi:NADPH:quinone reductase-like Zn-dependent oxidoreductase